MMRAVLIILSTAILSGLLAACASAPLHFQPVSIESKMGQLKAHAMQVLKSYRSNAGATAATLSLSEAVEEQYESVDASGQVNRYKISYTLYYRLADAPTKQLNYEIVVNHDESAYLASRNKRAQAVRDLREGALRQMFFLINRHATS